MTIAVAVLGATGRMGRAVLRALAADPELRLTGAGASPASDVLGADAGTAAGLPPCGVALSVSLDRVLAGADVAIDFTHPVAAAVHARTCAMQRCALLIGTSGLDHAAQAALNEASGQIAVLVAPNTSIGVNLFMKLAAEAARRLGAGYDVEILEAHHRDKRDAPSGTALRTGELIAAARGERLEAIADYTRHGETGPRPAGRIGFAVLRAGDIVGEHTVLFGGRGERLELTHRVTDRAVFADGAVRAARWLAAQPPGRYSMADALGL